MTDLDARKALKEWLDARNEFATPAPTEADFEARMDRLVEADKRLAQVATGDRAMTNREEWIVEGIDRGWCDPQNPPKRPGFLKGLPGVRHVAAFVLMTRVEKRAMEWRSVGVGLGHANPYDQWVVEGMWKGWV